MLIYGKINSLTTKLERINLSTDTKGAKIQPKYGKTNSLITKLESVSLSTDTKGSKIQPKYGKSQPVTETTPQLINFKPKSREYLYDPKIEQSSRDIKIEFNIEALEGGPHICRAFLNGEEIKREYFSINNNNTIIIDGTIVEPGINELEIRVAGQKLLKEEIAAIDDVSLDDPTSVVEYYYGEVKDINNWLITETVVGQLPKATIDSIITKYFSDIKKSVKSNFYVSFENNPKTLKYENVSNKYLFNNVNDIDFRVILLSSDFVFNKSDEKINDINLKEYKVSNEKEIENVKIKRDRNSLKLTIDNIVWRNERIQANYALIYDKNTNNLLYCIDFNKTKKSNSNNEFVIRFKDQNLFTLNKDNRFDLELLSILEGESYKIEAKHNIIKKELDKISTSKLFRNIIFKQPKFVNACFKNQKLFNLIKKDLLSEIFSSERFSFDYNFKKLQNHSILKIISSNKKMLSKLVLETKFSDMLIDNSQTIIKNHDNNTLKNILKCVIDNLIKNDKINKIYENYKVLIDNDKYLKSLYKNKVGDNSE